MYAIIGIGESAFLWGYVEGLWQPHGTSQWVMPFAHLSCLFSVHHDISHGVWVQFCCALAIYMLYISIPHMNKTILYLSFARHNHLMSRGRGQESHKMIFYFLAVQGMNSGPHTCQVWALLLSLVQGPVLSSSDMEWSPSTVCILTFFLPSDGHLGWFCVWVVVTNGV